MNTITLFKVLQLDTIIRVLSWKERVRIHLYLQNRHKSTTPLILKLYDWINENQWEAPNIRYGQERLLYYEARNKEWRPIEELFHLKKSIKL